MRDDRARGICYVDITKNLDRAACGSEVDDLIGDGVRAPLVTIYKSSVTCPQCRAVIAAGLDQLGMVVGVAASLSDRSTVKRISSAGTPERCIAVTP